MKPAELLIPNIGSYRSKRRLLTLVAAALLSLSTAYAFPPAPYFTLYGDVRDEYGNLLPAGDAYVIIYSGEREILRQTLTNPHQADYNYQVRLRMDMASTFGAPYSSIALDPGDAFSIAIEIAGQLFYPLQISAPVDIGSPAERRRFDLTLGTDSDGDGLPDRWEESQLYLAGYEEGENGWDLSLIDRDSDFNENGISNWAEYTAGTYADDTSTSLEIALKEIHGDYARLEFYAIFGRIYSLETSPDLENWTLVPLAFEAEQRGNVSTTVLQAETTGVISVYADISNPNFFFRLISR